MLDQSADSGRAADTWAQADRELVRAQRVANDTLEPDDIHWLCKGFSAFLASGGRLPLERCLRLPTNERALRRARRDHWLCCAWQELDPALSSWRRSEMLAAEVQRFQAGRWRRWSTLEQLPQDVSLVEVALFEAFKSYDRVPSTAMQLHNIASRCRAPAAGTPPPSAAIAAVAPGADVGGLEQGRRVAGDGDLGGCLQQQRAELQHALLGQAQ